MTADELTRPSSSIDPSLTSDGLARNFQRSSKEELEGESRSATSFLNRLRAVHISPSVWLESTLCSLRPPMQHDSSIFRYCCCCCLLTVRAFLSRPGFGEPSTELMTDSLLGSSLVLLLIYLPLQHLQRPTRSCSTDHLLLRMLCHRCILTTLVEVGVVKSRIRLLGRDRASWRRRKSKAKKQRKIVRIIIWPG